MGRPGGGYADGRYLALGDSISIDDYAGGAGRDAARLKGVRVAEVHERFLGHGLAVGNPAQGDPRPANRNLWHYNVSEPNAWGANGVRAAFWDAVDVRGSFGRGG